MRCRRDRSIPWCVVGFVCTAVAAGVVKIADQPWGLNSTDLAWSSLAWLVLWALVVAVSEISDMTQSVDAALRQGGGK